MSPTVEFDAVLALKRAGRFDDAVIALEDLLRRSPNDPFVLTQLADVQHRRGKPEEAARALDRAEGLAGTTGFTAAIRGNLHYAAKRWREAATSYREAVVLGDKGTWPLLQIARCHLRLNELDAARGAAAEAVERDGGDVQAWLILGDIALREGRGDDAVELIERAHKQAPADEYAYAKLVEARLLQLPVEDREREVETLLQSTAKGNRHLMGVLARLRSESGDDQRAAETWRARREQHGDLYARKMEAYALRRAGKVDPAAPLFRSCLLEDPQDVILYRTYVSMQHQRGALDELRATLEEMLPIAGPRRGAVYGELRKLDARTRREPDAR